MSHFILSGNKYTVHRNDSLSISDKLPGGNYSVGYSEIRSEFFLEQVDSFTLPAKFYGDITRQLDRVWNTFRSRHASTGVLLNGEKGSGKTLLAKAISVKANGEGIPTVLINQQFDSDGLNKFVQSIQQPCVVLMDEFEKVFDREHQEGMLTLLDGTFASQTLFLLTCNDPFKVNNCMINRPGRIYYYFDFKSMSEDAIREYCKENLVDQTQTDIICRLSLILTKFNFDQLKALVEEMNRYNESAMTALEMLNIKFEDSQNDEYDVSVIRNSDDRVMHIDYPRVFDEGCPMEKGNISIHFGDSKENTGNVLHLSQNQFKSLDMKARKYVYATEEYTVVFAYKANPVMDFRSLMLV